MTTPYLVPYLVTAFYERIWNAGDFHLIPELLAVGFIFRGPLGTELCGHGPFEEYVKMVRRSLGDYHSEILECVTEGDRAFAQTRFSGIHTGTFRGHEPTGKTVQWHGAALFRLEENVIAEIWAIDDLAGLDQLLLENEAESMSEKAVEEEAG